MIVSSKYIGIMESNSLESNTNHGVEHAVYCSVCARLINTVIASQINIP